MQAISNAANPENVREYISVNNGDTKTSEEKIISAGKSHTIPGTKPICVLCKTNNAINSSPKCSFVSIFRFFKHYFRRVDYTVLSKGIVKCCQILRVDLTGNGNFKGKTVILLSSNISSRKILDSLGKQQQEGKLMLYEYDDGVDVFDTRNVPKYYNCSESDKVKQKKDLCNWIDHGGVLLTHSQQFRGCEATNVVVVSHSGQSGAIVGSIIAVILALIIFFTVVSVIVTEVECVGFDSCFSKSYSYSFIAGVGAFGLTFGFFYFIIAFLLDRFFYRGNSLYRSNLTRAVAGLGLVVTERNVNRKEISKHYDVHMLVDNEC